MLEFTDTFIMILKRNDHQISFLHIYHHASTFLWWVHWALRPSCLPFHADSQADFYCLLLFLQLVVRREFHTWRRCLLLLRPQLVCPRDHVSFGLEKACWKLVTASSYLVTLECPCRYSYYLVSSAKVLRIPLAVKKSITIMQMVQFALLFSQV